MWAASSVRAHFFELPKNTMVTRRDLLHYGTQDSIDSAIRELRKKKIIRRVACGVYIRPHPTEPAPTAAEIAAIRIAAFHRTKVPSALDNARQHGLVKQGEQDLVYEVNAATSHFQVYGSRDRGDCVVYLKARVARKMLLDTSVARKVIKAVWFMGPKQCTLSIIARACQHFNKIDREEFCRSSRLMPGWMSDTVHLWGKWFEKREPK